MKKQIILLSFILLVTLLGRNTAFAQSANSQSSIDSERAKLEQELRDVENQIAQYEHDLTKTQAEKDTLKRKIQELKIKKAELVALMKKTSLELERTAFNLNETQAAVDANEEKITALQYQITQIIKQLYVEGSKNLFIKLLTQGDRLSALVGELRAYEQINAELTSLSQEVHARNQDLQKQKQNLSEDKDVQEQLQRIQRLQNQSLAQNLSDQSNLLVKTKGKEANYQHLITDTKKRAQEIRARIYELFEARRSVSFGEAVSIATYASKMTGVRPAFLLAILTQESSLGRNVGTCNRPNDPPEKNWKVIMKPDRDQVPFVTITTELGVPQEGTPVSCPMHAKNGSQIGWGGAMGPAQFIPSTWMGYKDKVTAITGKIADPWDIRDAFLAAAIKLKAAGAGSQDGEWAAALIYFSGSTNPRFRFYADSVVSIATGYQKDINDLNS